MNAPIPETLAGMNRPVASADSPSDLPSTPFSTFLGRSNATVRDSGAGSSPTIATKRTKDVKADSDQDVETDSDDAAVTNAANGEASDAAAALGVQAQAQAAATPQHSSVSQSAVDSRSGSEAADSPIPSGLPQPATAATSKNDSILANLVQDGAPAEAGPTPTIVAADARANPSNPGNPKEELQSASLPTNSAATALTTNFGSDGRATILSKITSDASPNRTGSARALQPGIADSAVKGPSTRPAASKLAPGVQASSSNKTPKPTVTANPSGRSAALPASSVAAPTKQQPVTSDSKSASVPVQQAKTPDSTRSETPSASPSGPSDPPSSQLNARLSSVADPIAQQPTSEIAPPDSAASILTDSILTQASVSAANAVSALAAVPTDSNWPLDRNIAMERSTTTSLGSAVIELSPSSKVKQAALGDNQNPDGKDRHSFANPDSSKPTLEQVAGADAEVGRTPVGFSSKAAEADVSRAVPAATSSTSSQTTSSTDRLHVIQQISDKLDTMRLTHGRQEMTVQLRPDSLGSVNLTVVTDRHSVSASIVTETAAARDAVHAGHDQLRASLEQRGYTLNGLDVSLGGSAADNRFNQFRQASRQPAAAPPNTTPVQPDPRDITAVKSVLSRSSLDRGRLDYQA